MKAPVIERDETGRLVYCSRSNSGAAQQLDGPYHAERRPRLGAGNTRIVGGQVPAFESAPSADNR